LVQQIARLSAISADFDGFILDQWGVLHDGTNPYDGAADSLARMRAAGKKIVILSNSGRLSAHNRTMLARMGIPVHLYDGIVTAGEAAREALRTRPDPAHRALGRRCLAFARAQDGEFFEELGLELVDDPRAADFLCVVGFDRDNGIYESQRARLDDALARGLPMVCANPDFARLTPAGLIEAPGVVAREYERRGGKVLWHGKPHASVYAASRKLLGAVAWDRVIAVGDSVEHDIRGAQDAGLRSVLVTGGVHLKALGDTFGVLPSPAQWSEFNRATLIQPDYLLAKFVW